MFNRVLFVIFILFQTTIAVSAGETEHVKLVCEDELLVAECPKGSTIEILSAVYGKQESKYCNSPGNYVNNCAAENSFHLVRFRCNYKQVCKISASNKVFGDPCIGTRKYLQVTYKCKSGETDSKIACEHEKLNIKCPVGHTIKIANALYGRVEQLLCYGENLPALSNTCSIENATEVVESICEDLQECTLNANNAAFGDPCVGTYKYLQVDFQCLPRQQIEQNIQLACEGELLEIACPKGSTIDILTATYGKKEKQFCKSPGSEVQGCEAGNTLNIVKFKCNRKQVCRIPSNNALFGDPCVGTRKYLEVTYECMTGNIESKIGCEGSSLTISCPEDSIIWTANALYGRKNPATCSEQNTSIKTNNCESKTALDVVQARCDNLQKCTIDASNGVFGDPCFGTFKYLEVDYQCLHSDTEIIRLPHIRIN